VSKVYSDYLALKKVRMGVCRKDYILGGSKEKPIPFMDPLYISVELFEAWQQQVDYSC
jgi:hypothetical protein